MLLKGGWDRNRVEDLIQVVADYAGDEEIERRLDCVTTTKTRIELGQAVQGFKGLSECLGPTDANSISRFLNVSKSSSRKDGPIQITSRSSKSISQEVWRRISDQDRDNPKLFLFGDEIARFDGEIRVLTTNGLWQELASRFMWKTRAGKKWVDCDPPRPVVAYMSDQSRSELKIPSLNGITFAPVMASDGTISPSTGYCPTTKLIHIPNVKVPDISETPSKSELLRASDLLQEVIADFPFVHTSDKAHALALMLLPFVRPIIDGPTPAHLIDKPKQGTGATLLAEVIGIIKTGEQIPTQPPPRTEEEWQKVILSNLRQVPEFIFIDNASFIYSSSLAMALTSNIYQGRILGISEMATLPIRCVWVITGNNVEMGADFPRRIAHIRLDANVDSPEQRTNFQHPDLLKWVKSKRAEIIWACLTLARNWIVMGKPSPKLHRASYESWSEVIGGILQAAGVGGFLETPEERANDFDPQQQEQNEFIMWWLAQGLKDENKFKLLARDILSLCGGNLSITAGFHSGLGSPVDFAKQKLRWMKDRVFTVFSTQGDEIRVKVTYGGRKGYETWNLEVIDADKIHGLQIGFADFWE